jgi:hypothetical protein
MGKKRRGGEIYKEIEDWLARMKYTGIRSEGAVWLAGEKRRVYDDVNVFDRVITSGKELEDGTISNCHRVWLSDWMVENINEFYLLSIDYDLHKQLRKPIAKSLLPVLQIGFYAAEGSYTKRYDELCQHLGIKEHNKFVYIERQLNPSFEDLRDKGFLAKWHYSENKLHKTYNIKWWAGGRFYEAQELLQEREESLMELGERKPKRITRPKPKQVEAQEQEVKTEAVPESPPEETTQADHIAKQARETKPEPQTPKQHPKPAPENTKGESDLVEKEEWKKIEQAQVEQKAKEMEQKQQEAERIDGIYDLLSLEQKEKIDEEAEKRARPIVGEAKLIEFKEGKTDSPMVESMIILKKRDVITEWLEKDKIKVDDSSDEAVSDEALSDEAVG